MTREQAINYLISSGFSEEQVSEIVRALTYEPTTKNDLGVDCISRADVNQVIEDYMDEQYHVLSDRTRERAFGANVVKARINELPSVTPQPKIGHWIPTYGNVKCSVCGSVKDSRNVGRATHYCDFCGAKMESKEE